jgi:RNase H-fold protein (predicted Holliday junction resolvase)
MRRELSSTEARRHVDVGERWGIRRDVIEEVAAVPILQSFLDSRR